MESLFLGVQSLGALRGVFLGFSVRWFCIVALDSSI